MKYDFKILTALSAGAMDRYGNEATHRREIMLVGKDVLSIPVIHGSSINGPLRRIASKAYLEGVNITRESLAEEPGLWDRIAGVFMSGGHCDGKAKPRKKEDDETSTEDEKLKEAVKLSHHQIRQLRELSPMLSVFGGAVYTAMMRGKWQTGWAWLDCLETAKFYERPLDGLLSAESYMAMSEVSRHADREEYDTELAGVTPMPRSIEYAIPGSTFKGEFGFSDDATEVEKSCVYYALNKLEYVGGIRRTGFGRVFVVVEGGDKGAAFEEWLKTYGPASREPLLDLFRLLVGSPKKKAAPKKTKKVPAEKVGEEVVLPG